MNITNVKGGIKAFERTDHRKDNTAEHKPRPDTSTYVYAGSLRVLGLAIGGYLLYNKFKKQEQLTVHLLLCQRLALNQKEIFLTCFKNFYHIIYKWLTTIRKIYIKESVYHGAVVSALAVGYTMLEKTLIKMSPPSLSKFDIEDGVKLVAIVAMFDFTKDYLIKQKVIPNNIQVWLALVS